MRSFFGFENFFLLGSYVLISTMPFIPLVFGKQLADGWVILACEAVSWVIIWGLFRRPLYFHILLLPAFLALPVELYLRSYYGQGISAHHLGILFESSPKEAAEFLGNKLFLLLGVIAISVGWWLLCWKASRRAKTLSLPLSAFFAAGTLLLTLGGLGLYGTVAADSGASVLSSASSQSEGSADENTAGSESGASDPTVSLPVLPPWADPSQFQAAFKSSWPFGLTMHLLDFLQERRYLSELSGKSEGFLFGSAQTPEIAEAQTYVLVIGESSRFDRWQLNGYTRPTNPLLSAEPNLISLSNVVSAVSATRLAVPILISRKPATQSLVAGFSERSVLSAFKEAGFKTFWLSNQMSFGQFDTPVSVYAKEADVTAFLNLGGYGDGASLDQVLLAPFHAALKDPAIKKLIVVHTLGNHWNYSHRYPAAFDVWKPSLYGVMNPAYTDLALKAQINNSYDNSVLYADWVLAQLIKGLKGSQAISTLTYVSDHGQTLYDGSCNLAFHGHNTDYEFHVPAFVWHSDAYQKMFPSKVATLHKNRATKLATENIFHSLLDMGELHYQSEQLDRSFYSTQLKLHTRYVDSYGWTDYDNATLKGDCREVIDNGKPLRQQK